MPRAWAGEEPPSWRRHGGGGGGPSRGRPQGARSVLATAPSHVARATRRNSQSSRGISSFVNIGRIPELSENGGKSSEKDPVRESERGAESRCLSSPFHPACAGDLPRATPLPRHWAWRDGKSPSQQRPEAWSHEDGVWVLLSLVKGPGGGLLDSVLFFFFCSDTLFFCVMPGGASNRLVASAGASRSVVLGV